MITSLLKTFLLSLPMSMGGLCNSGNSYVHNAYDRRNVATNEYNSAVVNDDNYYVIRHADIVKMMNNLPEYVQFTPYQPYPGTTRFMSYSYLFEFFTNYPNTSYLNQHFYGMTIYRNVNVIEFRAYLNKLYTFDSQDDYEVIYSYNLTNNIFTRSYMYDSIYVQNANINYEGRLDLDSYHNYTRYNEWSVFNYFFYKGLKSFTFSDDFNYNAPYGYDTGNTFIRDESHWVDIDHTSEQVYKYLLQDNGFICNGVAYKSVRLKYLAGYGNMYEDSDGEVVECEAFKVGFFYCLEYLPYDYDPIQNDNSYYACTRVYDTKIVPPGLSFDFIVNRVMWSNIQTRTIYFLNDISDSVLNPFYQINAGDGYLDTYYDIGLGNAFTLMKKTFLGFLPLMNIYIMPGLSIGLLLFLPLLMSIVVLVFKAVKK